MSTLVHSIRRRTLVVGLVVASFAGASGSAFAASEASPYGYAMQYTPKASAQKVAQSPYGYAVQYTPKASAQKIPESFTATRCSTRRRHGAKSRSASKGRCRADWRSLRRLVPRARATCCDASSTGGRPEAAPFTATLNAEASRDAAAPLHGWGGRRLIREQCPGEHAG